MEKKIELTSWQTLENVAKYLSPIFGAEISKLDVIQLCLDKKLKISIYLDSDYGVSDVRPFTPLFVPQLVMTHVLKSKGVDDWSELKDHDREMFLDEALKIAFPTSYNPETKTAMYQDVHELEGVYEVSPEDTHFFSWMRYMVMGYSPQLVEDEKPEEVMINFDHEVLTVSLINQKDRVDESTRFFNGNLVRNGFTYREELEAALVIQTKHLKEFIDKYVETSPASGPSKPTEKNNLSWRNLFAYRKRETDKFKYLSEMVDKYIEANGKLPSFNEIWQFIRSNDDRYDPRKSAVIGVSSADLDRHNLRTGWNDYLHRQ